MALFQKLTRLSHHQCHCFQQQHRFFPQEGERFPQFFDLSSGLASMAPERVTPW
jgi:hypothetical protein